MKKFTSVFYMTIVLSIAFILWGALAPDNLENIFSNMQISLQAKFSWLYHLSGGIILVFVIYLALSKYGHIKLGKDDDEPEYSTFSWFAMLFSAGMGIGLVFYGVAEPMSHFFLPPYGETETPEAMNNALQYTFLHWGFHPWAIYALVALALAYFKFRKDAPGTISATFYPLFGHYVKGPVGIIIDSIAVLATVFGVATSLGFGATQISGGIHYLNNDIANGFPTQFAIIIGVTILFMLSVLSGIGKGMKWISNINILLAILLMLFFLFLGPTAHLLDLFISSFGSYLYHLPKMSFDFVSFSQEGSEWFYGWTIFYWAWWIAWSPFVGSFIARVSKGRTIRQFVLGVLAVPTTFCALWFTIFGGTGVHFDILGGNSIWQAIDFGSDMDIALFATLNHLPFTMFTIILSILLIVTFFVTSADSATFVMGMQTTNGMLNPPLQVKVIWGFIQAAAATVLLWSGGLHALQSVAIVFAFPFTVILLFMMISLYKGLMKDG